MDGFMIPDDLPSDFGTDGPAATARTSRISTIEGKSGGSGNAPTVAVQARRYECECRLDLMRARGLDTKLWQAGMTFRRYWLACRQPQRVTAGYTEQMGGRAGPGSLSVATLEFWAEARGRLRQAFEVLNIPQRLAVIAVCGEDEDVDYWRKRTLRYGLQALSDLWCRPLGELRVGKFDASRRPWTFEEDEALASMSNREVAAATGRTIEAVRSRRSYLKKHKR